MANLTDGSRKPTRQCCHDARRRCDRNASDAVISEPPEGSRRSETSPRDSRRRSEFSQIHLWNSGWLAILHEFELTDTVFTTKRVKEQLPPKFNQLPVLYTLNY